MFRNTLKLLITNFSTAWKLLLYKIIVIGVVVGLFCATLGYLQNLPAFNELISAIGSFFGVANIATGPATIMTSLSNIFDLTLNFVSALFSTYLWLFIYLCVLLFVVLPYLWHLSDITVSEQIFGYMSSQTKYGFVSSFIRNLNRENSYSWAYTLIIFPINALFLAGIFGICLLAKLGGVWLFLAPAFLLVLAVLVLSLRGTFLSCWSSSIATTNCKTWKGLKKSCQSTARGFAKVWSNAIVFTFIFACLVILTGVIGLLVVIPFFCFVMAVFGQVVFFENQGMRYYVDFNTIISPKKLEETDKIIKVKFII